MQRAHPPLRVKSPIPIPGMDTRAYTRTTQVHKLSSHADMLTCAHKYTLRRVFLAAGYTPQRSAAFNELRPHRKQKDTSVFLDVAGYGI
jgi:hypothetical protein